MALEGGYDVGDLPFLRGNRVQVLRFLTFRPAETPNAVDTDVWALVGERTHCIAARFAREQVDRFHAHHYPPLSFTSLKGALLTLTSVRVSVERVQVETNGVASVPYRAGQHALVLDVRGCSVVSSVKEPVWYAGVKLVTSANGVPPGEQQRASNMVRWMKQCIRYKSLLARASAQQRKAQHRAKADVQPRPQQSDRADTRCEGDADPRDARPSTNTHPSATLPTPAQRNQAAVGLPYSSQAQTTPLAPLAAAHAAPPQSQSKESQFTQSLDPDHSTPSSADEEPQSSTPAAAGALWTDFDLDAQIEINLDDVDVPQLWSAPTELDQPHAMHNSERQSQPHHLQLASHVDAQASEPSDYESSRLARKRATKRVDSKPNKRKRQQALAAL